MPTDLSFVVEAEHDEDSRRFIIPWSEEQHREALTQGDLAHLICESSSHGRVGFAIIAGLTNPHQSIEFRRIVISPKGRGYGREAVRLIKQLAFSEWNAHRLWLDVKEHNHLARRLYESEGFTVEGTLRECLKSDAGFESLIVMSLLRVDYVK